MSAEVPLPSRESMSEDVASKRLCCTAEVLEVLDSDTELQKSIKRDIISHDNRAAQLRSQLNSLLPIARIPPEVLLEVFLFQAAMLREDSTKQARLDDYECHNPCYKWMNVSYVCTRWRQIALDCPWLWTWLAVDHRVGSTFTDMILERTRSFPLTVMGVVTNGTIHCAPCMSLESFCYRSGDAVSLLGTLVPRARELVVFMDKDELQEAWDSLKTSAEVLEDLRLEAFGSARFKRSATHPAWAAVPAAPFRATPRLSSLAVVGFNFQFTNRLLRSKLRHLEITACQCGPLDQESNLEEFLAVLRKLSRLETLKVDWSVKALASDSYAPVDLRGLKLLQISTDPSEASVILKHLRFSDKAITHYVCPDGMGSSPDELEALGQVCASLLKGSSVQAVWFGPRRPLRKSKEPLAACRVWVAEKRATAEAPPSGTPWTSFPPPTSPRFTVESHQLMLQDAVALSALLPLNLTGVRCVCIDGFFVGNKWARALRAANRLTSLRVLGEAAFGLPATLARGVPAVIPPWEDGAWDANEWEWVDFDDDTQIPRTGGSEEPEDLSSVDEDADMADEEQASVDGDDDEEVGEDDGAVVDAESQGGEEVQDIVDDGDGSGDGIDGDDGSGHGSDDGDDGEPVPPLFPQLDTITFVGVHFASSDVTSGALLGGKGHVHESHVKRFEAKGARYGFSIPAFLNCLRVRRAQGASDLSRVAFEDCCGATVSQLESLAAEGVEVWWDRKRFSSEV